MLSLIAKRAARRHTELVRPTVVATRGMCDIKSKHPVVSPHVTIYAFPVAAITSVTNRITGGALWVGLSGVGVYSLMGGDVASTVACIKASSLAAPAKFSVAFPVLYHYCYSIRHLVRFFFFRFRRFEIHTVIYKQAWEMIPEKLSTSTATSSAYALWAVSLAGSVGLAASSI